MTDGFVTAFLTLFLLAFVAQVFYYLYFFLRLALYTGNKPAAENPKPVSVIICAKNEGTNLKKNLPSVLGQQYPEFEVLVINDHSTDDTAEVVAALMDSHPQLRVLTPPPGDNGLAGKKNALRFGIGQAKHEALVLTDADCRPQSTQWLSMMSIKLEGEIQLVLGFSPYRKQKGMLNKWVRYECLVTAMQYFSFALAGMPYMGVGRNLAYKKGLFMASDQFRPHGQLKSGDDDLFVQSVAGKTNTAAQLDPQSFVVTAPAVRWREYYAQKYRHFSTGTKYKPRVKILLGTYHLSLLLFYVLIGALLFFKVSVYYWLPFLGFRLFLHLFIGGWISYRLKMKDLLWWLPVFDFLFIFYLILFTPAVLINKNIRWN